MKLFACSSSKDFSRRICDHLGIQQGKAEIGAYADGEKYVIIEDNVRNQQCVIIQSTCRSANNSVNDAYMELFVMIDALKRGSASKIVVVMPYYGYQRADKKNYSRAPISANVVATCLEALNADRVIVYDLHAGQIAGFFSNKCPMDNLYNEVYFIKYIREFVMKENVEIIIVSPDEGGMKTASRISSKLHCEAASIYKQRDKANSIAVMKLMGNVKGKLAILVDDIIDTAGTACRACQVLKDNGATAVYMLASHGLFSGDAISKIADSSFDKIVVTNTAPTAPGVSGYNKIEVIDVSWLCAEAIRRQNIGESLKELYDCETILEDNKISIVRL